MITNQTAYIEHAERMVRERLKYEYESRDRIVKRTKELSDIVYLSLAALRDHSPKLADALTNKADAIFQGDPQ